MSQAETKDNFFIDFLEDYFSECDEHLTIIRRDLLAIESFINQPQVDQEVLEELFRSFHTLKGLSGMVGIEEAEQLAHQLEAYLRNLRTQQSTLSTAGMDVLISGTMTLEQVIAAQRSQIALPDIEPVLVQLEAVLAAENGTCDRPVENDVVETVEENDAGIAQPFVAASQADRAEAERDPGVVNLSERLQQTWHFQFSPTADLIERGINVNSIRERLKAIGTITKAEPQITPTGGVNFHFTVEADADESTFLAWQEDGLSYRLDGAVTPAVTPAVTSATVTPAIAPAIELLAPAGPKIQASPASERIPERTSESATPAIAASPISASSGSASIVRVDLSKLNDLMRIVGELVVSRSKLTDQISRLAMPAFQLRALEEVNLTLERQIRELREGVMRIRLVPIGEIFTRMQFVVRDLARESGKRVALELKGQETEIDKFVVDRMLDPLLHLVRNAVSHGMESEAERVAQGKPAEGKMLLRAFTAGEMVVIEVEDDGRGIDLQQIAQRARTLGLPGGDRVADANTVLDILCTSGFSTRDEADRVSGRGVGMAVVKNTILELGGSITLNTEVGKGTCFTIHLPLTLAIADALIIAVGEQTYAVPQNTVREVIEVAAHTVKALEGGEICPYRSGALPLLRLSQLFELTNLPQEKFFALVVGEGLNAVGIVVDRIVGHQEIVIRALADPLVQVPGIAGATELGDGRVVLILDVVALIRTAKSPKTHFAKEHAGNGSFSSAG